MISVNNKKTKEDKLKESEKKYRKLSERYEMLLESIPDAIYSALPDETGPTTFMSHRWKDWTGYSPEDFYNDRETWLKSIHQEDRDDTIKKYIDAFKEKTEYALEYRVLHKNTGEIRHVRDRGFPIFDEKGIISRIDGMVSDITEIKETERKLRESEIKWRSYVENAPGFIITVDHKLNILFINRGVPGITKEQAIGTKVYYYIDRNYKNIAKEAIKKVFETSQPNSYEVKGVAPDGLSIAWYETQLGPVINDGEVIAVTLITTDITKRKIAEQKVRESEERLKALNSELEKRILFRTRELNESEKKLQTFLQLSPDFITIVDQDLTVQYINRTLPSLTREEVIGSSIFNYLQPEYHDKYRKIISQNSKIGNVDVLITQGPSVDNNIGWYESRIIPIKLEDQKISFMQITTDITERKKNEIALKEAHEELIRKEKLATVGKLAGSVAHELRNPLGIISNAVYYLNTIVDKGEEKILKYLKILQEGVVRSNIIITKLLEFTRIQPLSLIKININNLITNMLNSVKIPKNIILETNLYAKLPEIQLDSHEIQRVFQNIISNAIQAMPEGGKLEINTLKGENEIEIILKDTGVGILKENLPKIFEPLFTTKASGIGLGLSIVKEIIEKHKGTIEVESKVNVGTTVIIKLPL